MGAFWGLPDFGARQAAGDNDVYASYEPGPYVLWPSSLQVASAGTGRPDLQIVLVRAASGTASDYGMLDVRIERRQDTAGALASLRATDPAATVALAPFESGFIRMVAGPGLDNVPADLLNPSPIGWGGIDATRWNLQVSADSALILKSGLTSVLPLTVRAEVEAAGVAPRVNCTAVFDPLALVTALTKAASSRQIPRTIFDGFFNAPPASFTWLKLEGDAAPDREAFAQAMAGRVRMEFGMFVPSPTTEGPAYVQIRPFDPPGGTLRWDLSQPFVTRRAWVFTLDPFAAARELATGDPGALFREVTTSPLPFGFFNVDVQAFLPQPRAGIVDVGVVIQVPAKPPLQPQAESHTVVFQAPDDRADVAVRVPPLAKLAYVYKTFADATEGSHVRRLDGSAVNETTATLRLQAHDLPVDLLEMSADPALLAVAALTGTLDYTAPDGASVSTPFSLDSKQPRVAVALPRDASSATVTIDAHASPADGSNPVRLGPVPAAAQHVTLGSFQEYGGHTIAIACAFDSGATGPFGIDLIADGQPETPGNITTLFLTKDLATAEWSYLAASPFHAGYRWRAHPAGAWSAEQPPGAELHLAVAAPPPPKPQTWDIEGVHLYTRPDDPPGRVRYVPARPSPQLDSQGRPTLMLVDTGAVAILSIGTRFDLTDAERSDIEVALLQQMPDVQRVDFQPAPIAVGNVSLSIGDGTGSYQALATMPSMGAPPYNATFSVQLRQDQRTRAIAAITGTTGLLQVAYPVRTLPDQPGGSAAGSEITIRTTDVASWFASGAGAAHIQKAGV